MILRVTLFIYLGLSLQIKNSHYDNLLFEMFIEFRKQKYAIYKHLFRKKICWCSFLENMFLF